MNADVGVVIPSFNRPNETRRAVESVLKQTLVPKQIVVVDDGSDSENALNLRKLLQNSRVELIFIAPSRHPGIARNVGISGLSTKWVAFLDSDDEWMPKKLEIQLEQMLQSNAKASCSNSYINNVSSEKLYLPPLKASWLKTRDLLKENLVINSTVLIDRLVLERVGKVASSYSTRGAEDFATWLRVSTLTDWLYIDEPLIVYANDSPDSLRKSNEFAQNYLHISGLLDFQSWLESRGEARGKWIRLYLRLLGPMIERFRKSNG